MVSISSRKVATSCGLHVLQKAMSFLIIIFSKYLVQLYKQYSKQFFNVIPQGVRKSVLQSDIWASCSVACTSPNVISTSLKNFLTSRIDYTVFL